MKVRPILIELLAAAFAVVLGYTLHFIVVWNLAETLRGRSDITAAKQQFGWVFLVGAAAAAGASPVLAMWIAREARASALKASWFAVVFEAAGVIPYLYLFVEFVVPKIPD